MNPLPAVTKMTSRNEFEKPNMELIPTNQQVMLTRIELYPVPIFR